MVAGNETIEFITEQGEKESVPRDEIKEIRFPSSRHPFPEFSWYPLEENSKKAKAKNKKIIKERQVEIEKVIKKISQDPALKNATTSITAKGWTIEWLVASRCVFCAIVSAASASNIVLYFFYQNLNDDLGLEIEEKEGVHRVSQGILLGGPHPENLPDVPNVDLEGWQVTAAQFAKDKARWNRGGHLCPWKGLYRVSVGYQASQYVQIDGKPPGELHQVLDSYALDRGFEVVEEDKYVKNAQYTAGETETVPAAMMKMASNNNKHKAQAKRAAKRQAQSDATEHAPPAAKSIKTDLSASSSFEDHANSQCESEEPANVDDGESQQSGADGLEPSIIKFKLVPGFEFVLVASFFSNFAQASVDIII